MDTNLQLETIHDAQPSPGPCVNAGAQDWRLEASMLPGLALFVDVAICLACGWLTWLIRFENFVMDAGYMLVIALLAMVHLNMMAWCGGYKLQRLHRLPDQVRIIALGSAFTLFIALLLGFATKVTANYSRIFIASWFAASFVGLVGGRAILKALIAHQYRTGRLGRRVLIVGTGALAVKMADRLRRNATEFSVIGFLSVEDMVDDGPRRVANGAVVGSVAEVVELCRNYRADLVVMALPWSDPESLDKVALLISAAPVDVRLGTPFIETPFPHKPVSQLSGLPVIELANRPFAGWSRVWKRLEDILIASFALVLLSPVLVAVSVLVKLDSRGPIFFVQRRHGFANSEILVYKFRTMRVASDISQAQPNDPRVTRIGRVLRRLSLDELPQLVNVLQGRMSLVGPRPHALEYSNWYAPLTDRYFARHRVKPGITGWAQVNGLRGEVKTPNDIRRRIEFDLHYVEKWSVLFDLRIMFRTLLIVFNSKTAY
jgi:putative colanic acid biosynthesis UDP-glucose lipid carrier transferase